MIVGDMREDAATSLHCREMKIALHLLRHSFKNGLAYRLSTNSPSHLATTTEARQLPTTFTVVRAMSFRASIRAGRRWVRWEVEGCSRGQQDDQRRARNACDALAGEHERQHHHQLLTNGEMDSRSLRDEDARAAR